ncbi:MAG: hypothetical protein ACE5JD_00650 [Candidatus Methylomirabilia bacterium]
MSLTPLWRDSTPHSVTRGVAECEGYWSLFALLASFPTTPGWLELCARDPGSGRTIRFWTVPEEVEKIRCWLAARASYSHAFFGIARRARASAGTPSLASLPLLWANVNRASVHVPPEVPPPTVIVFTGRGHHLYWALREAVELSLERVRTVDRVLRGLARCVQADPGSAEAGQLLRVPGTLNAKYRPPVCTTVILL